MNSRYMMKMSSMFR